MKLTKRLLCLILSLCMVFLAVPAFAFPIVAAESQETVTISFRLADKRGEGAVGTLVAERKVTSGFAEFAVPTPEECTAAGIDAADVLGWYVIDTAGVYYDAADYSGTYIAKDMVFYPYLKSSSLAFGPIKADTNPETNFPIYSGTSVTGFRGGWQVGRINGTVFTSFDTVGTGNLTYVNGENAWKNGGVYLSHRNGQGVLALGSTAGYATTLSWTALVDGKVSLDFSDFYFLYSGFDGNKSGEPETVQAFVAVAHNGKYIWPAALKGQSVDVNDGFDGYYTTSAHRDDISDDTKNYPMVEASLDGATVQGLEVKGGDTVSFIIGRDNVGEAMLNATVTYTETTDNYGDQVISSIPAYQPGKPLEVGQKFVETGTNDPDDAKAEISYPGDWEMIVYDKPADIDARKSFLIDHYTTQSTVTRAFLTAKQDYLASKNAPVLVNHEASVQYGQDYSFLFNINSKAPQTPAAVGGYRYTAEHTGYIQATFDKLNKDSGSYSLTAASFTEVRIAIFVDGVMVWPTANGDATDYANWCAPYSVPDTFTDLTARIDPVEGTDYTNQRDAINEQLKDLSFFVSKGSQIDFLITYASYVNAVPRTANSFLPAVAYSKVFNSENTAFVSYNHPATGMPVIMDVTKGDTVVLPDFPAGYAFLGWDINGDGQVDYKAGATIQVNADLKLNAVQVGATSFQDNVPTYDEESKTVIYHGGWEVGAYDKYGETFMPYSDYIAKNKLLCHYGNAWNQWGGFYATSDARFAMSTGTIPSGSFWSQIQYTTPMTGTIAIDLKELAGWEDPSSSKAAAAAVQPLSFKIAIYKNNEKIWPAGNGWATVTKDGGFGVDLLDLLQAQYPDAFPLKVNVNTGDIIEFRAENQNDTSYMLAMNPSIVYTTLNEAPTVTATAVTVKETFTLNVYTHLNASRTDYVASGLKYWTSLADAENKAGNYKALSAAYTQDNTAEGAALSDVTAMYSIKGISAWELNKSYYVRTWVQYADGTVKDGDVVEVSVIGYAQNAINKTDIDSSLNRIATALLQYTIAIEEYRGNDCGLTMPDKLPVMPVIIPENAYNLTTLEGGKVTMLGANLVLGETIDLVIDFTTTLSKDRAEKLVVLMDDNASFLTPQELKAVEVEDGIYRVTVKIRTVDFSKPFYFKVMDHRGDVQSGVLTYSVESYVARKCEQEPENAKLIALLNSMLVLCKTANDIR